MLTYNKSDRKGMRRYTPAIHRWTMAITIVAGCINVTPAVRAECGIAFIEFRTGSTNAFKPGRTGFLGETDEDGDIKIYRTETTVHADSMIQMLHSYESHSFKEDSTITRTWPDQAGYCNTTSFSTVSGSGTRNYVCTNNLNVLECLRTDQFIDGVWVPGAECSGCAPGDYEYTIDGETNDSYRRLTITATSEGTSGTLEETITLGSIYTTEALVTKMLDDANSQVAAGGVKSCSGSGSFSLSEDGICGSASAAKFKIKYFGPKDVEGEIVWRITYSKSTRYSTLPSWSSTITNKVTFTGRPQETDEFDLTPVYESGIRSYSATVELLSPTGCGGGSGFGGYQTSLEVGPFIKFGLSPGGCSMGGTAGFLFIAMDGPSMTVGVDAFVNACRVTTAGSGSTRQYAVDDGTGGVCEVTEAGSSCTLDFYSSGTFDPETGWYETGVAAGSYTVTASEEPLRYRLTIAASAGGYTEYVYQDGFWYIDYGNGMLAEASSGTYNEEGQLLSNIHQTLNNAQQVIYQESVTYTQPPGFNQPVIMTKTVGLGGDALTSYWFYNTNVLVTDTNYGKLVMWIDGQGRWERYEYDAGNGRLVKRIAVLGNAPTNALESASRVTEYSYTPFHPLDDGSVNADVARVTTEWVNGHRVAMTGVGIWTSGSIAVQFAGPYLGNPSEWNQTVNLKTVTTNITYLNGICTKVIHPDNTLSTSSTYSYPLQDIRQVFSAEGMRDDSLLNVTNGVGRTTWYSLSTGRITSQTTYDIDADSSFTRVSDGYTYFSSSDPSYTVSHADGTTEAYNYSTCCGLASHVDRDGVVTYYEYEATAQKRQIATRRLGIMTSNVLDNAGNVVETWRVPTSGAAIRLAAYTYDTTGRQKTVLNALNHGTTNGYRILGDGRAVNSTTNADGSYREEYVNRDGSVERLLGTAVFPVQYTYDVDTAVDQLYTVETKLDAGGNTTSEWTSTYTDALGRAYKRFSAAPAGQSNPYTLDRYNNLGQRDGFRDADGNWIYYFYDGKGQMMESSIDMDGVEARDDTVDRTTRTTYSIIQIAEGNWVRRTSSTLLPAGATPDRFADVSLDGLTSWSVSFGQTNISVRTPGDPQTGVRTVTTIAPDGTSAVSTYTFGRLTSTVRYDASTPSNVLASTSYESDALGRQWKTTDARNGVTTYGFNDADQITAITNPPAATGQPSLVVRTDYDSMGRATSVTQPDSTTVSTSFHPNGLVKRTWGSRTYPVEYAYDHQGRLTNMTTWQSFASDAGKANTAWDYDGYRGFLIGKRYHGQAGPIYTNTPGGRLQKRTWARDNLSAIYSYNPAGQITGVDYSDSIPDVTYFYTHRGFLATNSWGTNTLRRIWYDSGALQFEIFNNLLLYNRFDGLLRRTNVTLYKDGSKVVSHGFSFSADGRLGTVTDGTNSATYSYVANSPLVEQIAFKRTGQTRMTTSKLFDKLNRLTQIRSVDAQSVPVASFDYNYNPASQRTSVTNADGSYWAYSYDALGQVTSGKKCWSDGTPVLGQQFDYTFDDIGNRKTAVTGGDQWGANKRYQNYTANLLNQYAQRTVPGYADLKGTANSNATVTVQSSTGVAPASRKREYFRAEVAAQNNSAPVWLGLTNVATLTNGANTDIVTNTTGRLLVVQTPEVFAYDLDGNLLRDGQWTNSWDGENRLISQETLPAVYGAGAPRQRLEYDYDPQGRRLVKRAYDWVSGNWSLKYAVRFVWDGWNLLAELNPTNHLGIRSYAWGLDLSGSAQGAGGVGGLLWVAEHGTAQPSVHFAAFDGNGNVAALLDAVAGTVSANYEYGPFGETIRSTGPLAKANPLHFSTKYEETETGCLYYGYRSYNSSTGRWPSRDPIGELGFHLLRTGQQIFLERNRNSPPTSGSVREAAFRVIKDLGLDGPDVANDFLKGQGGLNLFCLNGNDPLDFVDFLGLAPFCICIRADDDHAWIWVKDLATGQVHTYGRWAKGYGRPKVNTSGVVTDQERNRGHKASRCVQVQSFTPTINPGYNTYNNNCATYARDEWERITGEDLDIDEVGNIGWDSPSTLKDSINEKNTGKNKSADCCGAAVN